MNKSFSLAILKNSFQFHSSKNNYLHIDEELTNTYIESLYCDLFIYDHIYDHDQTNIIMLFLLYVLEILKIKDLKIGIGIEKKQQNKAEDNVRKHLIISLSCILNTHQQIC